MGGSSSSSSRPSVSPAFRVPPGGMWIYDAPASTGSVGDPIAVPAGSTIAGSHALVMIGGEAVLAKYLEAGTSLYEYIEKRRVFLADDSRILAAPVPRAEEATMTVVGAMYDDPEITLPIDGPKTALFLADRVAKSGGSFVTRHHRWVRESGIGPTDRNVFEHEVLSHLLHYSATWDHLDITNSAGLELAGRRLQLIEEAVSENPSQPSWEGSRHYMGLEQRRGGAVLDTGLRAFVATELGKEAAVVKEKRKAREARGSGGGGGCHGKNESGKGAEGAQLDPK